MTIYAKVIADSISPIGRRIVTVEAQYPRFIHGEVMTHRAFSRNAMSSRAIPVAKMVEQVRNDPAMPVYWGANQPGMQASAELSDTTEARQSWCRAARQAADVAEHLNAIGLHKQIANRVLEPFQWMRTLITATEWGNFFELRMHPDAQPEFQHLAKLMFQEVANSTPVERFYTGPNSWHLPYVSDAERAVYREDVLLKLSTARCARVSYLTHDGENPDIAKDIELYQRLVGSTPIHASPCEHQAQPLMSGTERSRNFVGWKQHRESVERNLKEAAC